jgi:hypothetical protein
MIQAEVKIEGVETFHFWPYLNAMLPMKEISGILDLNAHYQGDLKGTFKASAKIKFKELLFDYPKVFYICSETKVGDIDVEAEYDSKDMKIQASDISGSTNMKEKTSAFMTQC